MNYQWPAKFNFITKTVTIEKAKGKGFYIRGYASASGIVDRQDEIVSSEALKGAVAGLLEDGDTLFFNHNYDQPIGLITKAVVDKKGLFIEAFISETRPDIRKQIEEGILKRFSIGGEVLEAVSERNNELGREVIRITKMVLYEVSLVGVPANPKAEVIDYVIKCALQDKKKIEVADRKKEDVIVKDEKTEKVVEATDEKSIREALEAQKEKYKAEATVEAEQAKVDADAEAQTEEEKIAAEKNADAEVVDEKIDEEVVDAKVEDEVKNDIVEDEKKDEKVETKVEEKVDEVVDEKVVVEDEVDDEKAEKSVVKDPEDMIEKTTEKDVSLAKMIEEKVNAIHKAVLMNSKPVVTLWDTDVKEIIPDFEKLAVGTEIKLKVTATVVEKAEMANGTAEGDTYKALSFQVSEVAEYGKRTEKQETPTEEVKVEKSVEVEKEVVKEVEAPKRKGIMQEREDDIEASLTKKLSGKSPMEIMNDDNLWDELDDVTKSEVKKAYKTGIIQF